MVTQERNVSRSEDTGWSVCDYKVPNILMPLDLRPKKNEGIGNHILLQMIQHLWSIMMRLTGSYSFCLMFLSDQLLAHFGISPTK